MKVLFLQIKGNSVGGIWFVNKRLCEELTNRGYEVEVLSIRNNPGKIVTEDNLNFKVHTINKKDLWEITHKSDVLKSIKHFKFFRTSIKYIIDYIKLKKDYSKGRKYINNFDPDYIVASHYQLLDMIPKKYWSHTFYHHHTSLEETIKNRLFNKLIFKYNNKINFLWLTKSTMDLAISLGLNNNYQIYNPVRFESDKVACVINNKKIVVITRISEEKRIDLMARLVDEAFKKNKNKDWIFEIYGTGKLGIDFEYDKKHIKFMGSIDNPKDVLLTSSINLNTSLFEGFCLSILEANECGIPTISFNFGESVYEQIIDGKTGYIAKDEDEFVNKLIYLMNDKSELKRLSDNCKKYNTKFNVKNICNDFEDILKRIG